MAKSTSNEIPKEMRRLVVASPGNGDSVVDCTIEVQTAPTPVPASGEVLVKVVAAPINPSDYGSWYRSNPSAYPMYMGKEGCGVVVSTGGGLLSSYRCPVGTKVGFFCADNSKQGSYSEYVVVNAMTELFPMPDDVPIEDCASFMVNPYTAVGIIDTAQQAGSAKAIVHTAAASQLGQMLNKLAPTKGMEIINVVRREDQKELLENLGAKHIIVTSGTEEEWKAELKAKVTELGAKCAFDAVSGDMTGHLMDCMPGKGIVYLYGGLAGKAGGINPSDLIYRKKELKSFFLTSWISGGGPMKMVPRMLSASKVVNSGLKSPEGWCCSQFEDVPIAKAHEEIVKVLGSSATGKKLRIRFDGEETEKCAL